jgi:oligopeptide transport system ATP-binding protein
MKICLDEQPPEMQVPDGHYASCWLNVKKAKEAEKGAVQHE